jgi:REP element-mobilizing transposase RayT
LFGDVKDGLMILSHAGLVIESWWRCIPNDDPNVSVDAVVVMPNHIHGVLRLGAMAESPDALDLPTLSEVIQRFKGRTTNDYILGANTEGWPRFDGTLWQEGYYDHIIRSDRDLECVREYIEANPGMWMDDEYYIGVDD